MLTKTKVAVAAALIIASASLGAVSALAGDNTGDYTGGFVVPGNSAVNPAYHPRWSGIKGGEAFGYVAPHVNTLRNAPAMHEEDNYGSEAGKE